MGRRGPAPTPTEILGARGSWRAKQNRNEPKPTKGPPPCPRTLKGEAKKLWKPLVQLLESMGVLTVADGGQLERYCVYFARWRACEAHLAKHGLSYAVTKEVKKQGGEEAKEKEVSSVSYREFPEVKESHRLDKALRQAEDRFGLSPSARARLQAEADEEPSLNGKGRFFGSRN